MREFIGWCVMLFLYWAGFFAGLFDWVMTIFMMYIAAVWFWMPDDWEDGPAFDFERDQSYDPADYKK